MYTADNPIPVRLFLGRRGTGWLKGGLIAAAVIAAVLLIGCTGQTTATLQPEPPIVREPLQCPSQQTYATDGSRPNILIILTDDQTVGTMQYMPQTQARIFDQGVTFENAFTPTPLCCPSRATIFTGLYAHNTGIYLNKDTIQQETFYPVLQEAGYYTGLIGKYLNSYPRNPEDPPAPGIDYWVAHGSLKQEDEYYNYWLNVNGELVDSKIHLTLAARDYVLKFLDEAAQQEKPFALMFALHAPHGPSTPVPGDEDVFADAMAPRPSSFNEEDISDMPPFITASPDVVPLDPAKMDRDWGQQARSLWGADQAIDAVLNRLEEQGQLDNTAIFFLSDNGVMYAEHQLKGKNLQYDPALRVPFGFRYPPIAAAGTVDSHLVLNADIAPTIYDLAGVQPPCTTDGQSLVDLLSRDQPWRTEFLTEGINIKYDYRWLGIRGEDFAYIESLSKDGQLFTELYDLTTDPEQNENIASNRDQAARVQELHARLRQYFTFEEMPPFPSKTDTSDDDSADD